MDVRVCMRVRMYAYVRVRVLVFVVLDAYFSECALVSFASLLFSFELCSLLIYGK